MVALSAVVARAIDEGKGLPGSASLATGAVDSVARVVFGTGLVLPVAVRFRPPALWRIRFAGVEVVSCLDEDGHGTESAAQPSTSIASVWLRPSECMNARS